MKYNIDSYDREKDIAVVTIKYKFQKIDQPPVTIRAHNVPVDDPSGMEAFTKGFVVAKKIELRALQNLKSIHPSITSEQTVTDPPE